MRRSALLFKVASALTEQCAQVTGRDAIAYGRIDFPRGRFRTLSIHSA